MGTPKIDAAKSLADECLEKADLQALHRMFMEKCEDLEKIMAGLPHILNCSDPKMQPVNKAAEVCESMQNVALAAIQLARDVATPDHCDRFGKEPTFDKPARP